MNSEKNSEIIEVVDDWNKIPVQDILIKTTTLHARIGQQLLLTTADKLELFLRDYSNDLKARLDWKAPAGIFVTLIATLATAEFKLTLWLSSEVWWTAFLAGTLSSGVWLLRAGLQAFRSRGVSIDRETIVARFPS